MDSVKFFIMAGMLLMDKEMLNPRFRMQKKDSPPLHLFYEILWQIKEIESFSTNLISLYKSVQKKLIVYIVMYMQTPSLGIVWFKTIAGRRKSKSYGQ
jgi:hypothetical protein